MQRILLLGLFGLFGLLATPAEAHEGIDAHWFGMDNYTVIQRGEMVTVVVEAINLSDHWVYQVRPELQACNAPRERGKATCQQWVPDFHATSLVDYFDIGGKVSIQLEFEYEGPRYPAYRVLLYAGSPRESDIETGIAAVDCDSIDWMRTNCDEKLDPNETLPEPVPALPIVGLGLLGLLTLAGGIRLTRQK